MLTNEQKIEQEVHDLCYTIFSAFESLESKPTYKNNVASISLEDKLKAIHNIARMAIVEAEKIQSKLDDNGANI